MLFLLLANPRRKRGRAGSFSGDIPHVASPAMMLLAINLLEHPVDIDADDPVVSVGSGTEIFIHTAASHGVQCS